LSAAAISPFDLDQNRPVCDYIWHPTIGVLTPPLAAARTLAASVDATSSPDKKNKGEVPRRFIDHHLELSSQTRNVRVVRQNSRWNFLASPVDDGEQNMKIFVTVVGGALLALSCVTASDARQHTNRKAPTQSESYYRLDYYPARDRDGSCFSRSTGLPDQYACSLNGG
jgi:hypothetical protein